MGVFFISAYNLECTPPVSVDDDGPQQVDGHLLRLIMGYAHNAHYIKICGLCRIEFFKSALLDIDGVILFYQLRVHDYKGK